VWCSGQNKREAALPFFHGCHKGEELIALKLEIDCDQTAMGLPPVTSAVFILFIFILFGTTTAYIP
jgi:hypothetical protein